MSNIDKQALRKLLDRVIANSGMTWYSEEQLGSEDCFDFPEVDADFIAALGPKDVLALLDELDELEADREQIKTLESRNRRLEGIINAAEKRISELEALARGVKQFSEFQICHYGATEDYAKGYIDCQNNYNKVLFAATGKGE